MLVEDSIRDELDLDHPILPSVETPVAIANTSFFFLLSCQIDRQLWSDDSNLGFGLPDIHDNIMYSHQIISININYHHSQNKISE